MFFFYLVGRFVMYSSLEIYYDLLIIIEIICWCSLQALEYDVWKYFWGGEGGLEDTVRLCGKINVYDTKSVFTY